MASVGPKRGKYQKYDVASLRRAAAQYKTAQRNGVSLDIRTLSKAWKIPRSTLHRWILADGEGDLRAGRISVLSDDTEELLVSAMEFLGDLGWPLSPSHVQNVVKSFLDSQNIRSRFKDNLPGKRWLEDFKKRWKGRLSIRKPEYVTVARAKGLTPQVVDGFFDMLGDLVERLGIEEMPNCFYNLDETGLGLDPHAEKAFYRRGTRNAQYVVPSEGKSMFTVLFCGNASGTYLPPYVVYKGKGTVIDPNWTVGCVPGTTYNITTSGWMEDFVFEAYFRDVFVPFVQHKPKPIVLFFDGHNSHITFQTAKLAITELIHIVCIPPHSSSALQPLDVAVYGPAKKEWYKILQAFYREVKQKTVQKANFPALLGKLFTAAFKGKPENAISGFRKAGLFPVDRNQVPEAKLKPSLALIPDESSILAVPDDTTASTSHDSLAFVSPLTSTPFPSKKSALTPHTALRTAIIQAVCPQPSTSTQAALTNGQQRRKRVQHKYGEVLTEESALERLRLEEEERQRKKARKTVLDKNCENHDSDDDVKCAVCDDWDPPDLSENDNNDVDWVACDCGRWFHALCVTNLDQPCDICRLQRLRDV